MMNAGILKLMCCMLKEEVNSAESPHSGSGRGRVRGIRLLVGGASSVFSLLSITGCETQQGVKITVQHTHTRHQSSADNRRLPPPSPIRLLILQVAILFRNPVTSPALFELDILIRPLCGFTGL